MPMRRLALACCAVLLALAAIGAGHAADPSILWRIVDEGCVPDEIEHHDPSPCALVDLSQGQIVGTWDKSKLKNQFVQTGEILFEPDTTYSGAPIPPVLLQPTSSVSGGKTYVTIAWQQERPDLINSYIVSYAIETQVVEPSRSPRRTRSRFRTCSPSRRTRA